MKNTKIESELCASAWWDGHDGHDGHLHSWDATDVGPAIHRGVLSVMEIPLSDPQFELLASQKPMESCHVSHSSISKTWL